ncbi:DUF6894 family protein [Lichenibacterium dinghuense]|uniref:DUF6894 family protein n=1 Tax=Lichenibacterium dinghuense TaxID=2895977 RepID=UPI001F381AD5|nr:hypothetical protein [Lichenibacterium sp. 6Y81]
MPLFHFHLVASGEREHVGTLDLPSRGNALPAGIRLTMSILADLASADGAGDGLVIQATDNVGAVVYTFDVSQEPESDAQANSYLHLKDARF